MSIDLVILVTSVVATTLLGVVIFSRNPQARINRIFAFFTASISLWAVSNFLADNGPASFTLMATRITFLFGLLIACAALLLSANFPHERVLKNKLVIRSHAVLLTLTFLVSLTPMLVSKATKTEGAAAIEVGPLYATFLIYILFALCVIARNFFVQYRTATQAIERRQISLVLTGIFSYGILAILSNLILPIIVDNWASSSYGPIFALITVALIGYAIVRHRLFDIRLYAVRSAAYLLSLLVATLLYVIPAVLLTSYVLHTPLKGGAMMTLVAITLIVAFLFQPLKRYFDLTTKRLFYRDAYDPQAFFNQFNQALVSSAELDRLLNRATSIITDNLKSSYCFVVLGESKTARPRVIGVGSKEYDLSKEDVQNIESLLLTADAYPVVTDYLTQDNASLKVQLLKNDIAVLAPLLTRPGQGLGYVIFGPRKSGNPYSSQDVQVIETLSNELVIAIQNALRFEEIERFNLTLQRRVDEATLKLRRSNEKLRKLDETKDDFISMASHQLRTPLTSVKGYVSMVLDGDAGKITALQRKLLSQSFISSQRMVYLISDLLNVSRLRTGKFVIEAGPTNLAKVIQEEIEQLIETAKGRGLEMVYHKPEHFPMLMLDETKMRQVIMNFIDNAVYYTQSGGHIDVYLMDKPASVEFTVVDNGIGVPRHDQHHLFTKFFRAHNAKRARPDGTGLGLFMAKKVIVAQGGAVIFKSQEGRGSTFGFTFAKNKLLPTDKATPTTAPAVRA